MNRPNTLTPAEANKYLRFKVDKEQVNFFPLRSEIVPDKISASDFCKMINKVREKIWEYNDQERRLKEEQLVDQINNQTPWQPIPNKKKENNWEKAVSEIVIPVAKSNYIKFRTIRSLVGLFMGMYRDSKYEEYCRQTEERIADTLSQSAEARFMGNDIESPDNGKPIREVEDVYTDNNISVPEPKDPSDDNSWLHHKAEEFNQIMNSLIQTYHLDQGLGEPNKSEMETLFNQAWRSFETKTTKTISDETSEEEIERIEEEQAKLRSYLYEEYIEKNQI